MQDFDDLILGHVYFPVADLNGAAKPEQAKEVDVTANGTQTVVPDSGYALSSVTINTNVPAPAIETQEKSITITQNGASEVTPDTGKYLSKVSITTNVPQITTQVKSVEITTNGETAITPDEGYGAMTQVNLNVAVPLPENKLPSVVDKSVTEITADDLGDITSIGLYAFYDCQNLTSITIPASVTAIGDHALQCGSTTNLVTITMLGETPPTIQTNTMQYDNIAQIIVPTGKGDTYKAAPVWSNFAAKIVEVGGGGVTYDPVFANNSWAQIAEASENNQIPDTWVVGDEKTIELTTGEQVTLVILGFNHDDLTSGGKAGITLGMKNLLATVYEMNSSKTNEGGWDECKMRTSTMATLLSQLPADLQSVIKQVNKKATAGSQSTTITTSEDKLFLFALAELASKTGLENSTGAVIKDNAATYEQEGTQYEYFKNTVGDADLWKDCPALGKKLSNGSGSALDWWLRSSYLGSSVSFECVFSSGIVSGSPASALLGVSFGFCV